jgi:polysaccharide export outer membrane protein
MFSPRKIFYLFILILPIGFCSCLPKEKMVYFSEEGEGSHIIDYANYIKNKKIKARDRLYIKILSLDEKTTRLFSEESRLYGELDMHLNSYEVSDSGYIDFPFVGRIYVEGYTLSSARARLEDEISMYLPNTAIKLKYAGNYITILGEVNRPGNHLFFKEKISVFEALAHAGGIRDYGNKQEVIIIRDLEGETNYNTIDITRKDITNTYYYYLLPDDVVIVQPLNAKFRTLRNFQLESLLLSGITTMITVMYFIINN